MKIFTSEQIRYIDANTIKLEPIISVDLMERAAIGLMRWLVINYSPEYPFLIFVGPGNNGGDGLALARLLTSVGFDTKVFLITSSNYSVDHQTNLNRLINQDIINPSYISSYSDFPIIPENAIIIDSLFGSGLTRNLNGVAAELVNYINSSNNHVVSVDIPSGLFSEENPATNSQSVIRADITLTIQFPKLSFFFPENLQYVGKWIAINIDLHPKVIEETSTQFHYIDNEDVKCFYPTRDKFAHKGNFGHCLLIAGSYGMLGAAILSTNACIRAGAGLVTIHIPRLGYSVLQHSIPEALVNVDDNDWYFTGISSLSKYSAIGVGPGLGKESKTITGLKTLLSQVNCPLVIDADGLNILAKIPEMLNILPENSILTPHVGEFKRLFGKSESGYVRLKVALEMASKYKVIILLKGAFSQVVCPNGKVFFNSTGNPGMASGGSGDVLTGIITSLLGQGYSPADAALFAVYLHGKAGDIAAQKIGQSSLKASDIIDCLGDAFLTLNN
jgi:NAD(P)H-hydrate epimerase